MNCRRRATARTSRSGAASDAARAGELALASPARASSPARFVASIVGLILSAIGCLPLYSNYRRVGVSPFIDTNGQRLNTAYVLKESFGQLWDYEHEGWARRFFENWRASLKWQRLGSYQRFAETIDRHWDGIAAYCKPENKVSLGFVEGLNNKIRVVPRRAYGLRDREYLRLKVLTCMLPEI